MRLTYLVSFDVSESDYNAEHTIGSAPRLFADEIQSNLESCPEPGNVKVQWVTEDVPEVEDTGDNET